MLVENLDRSIRGGSRGAAPAALPAGWLHLAAPLAIGSALFSVVFLIISVLALRRARAQDIPETVRALAHLFPFHRAAASLMPSESAADGDERDPVR